MVAAASFARRAKRDRLRIFSASLYDINHALDRKSIEEGKIKLEDLIPADCHDFLPLFLDIAPGLQPLRSAKDGFTPPSDLLSFPRRAGGPEGVAGGQPLKRFYLCLLLPCRGSDSVREEVRR